MAKQCPLRFAETDTECQKNKCEWYLKYRIGEVETKECALVSASKFKAPPAGATVLE